jgi:hypothetical protein
MFTLKWFLKLTSILCSMVLLSGCMFPYNDVVPPPHGMISTEVISGSTIPNVGDILEIRMSIDSKFTDPKKYTAIVTTDAITPETPPYVLGGSTALIADSIDIIQPVMTPDRMPVLLPLGNDFVYWVRFRIKLMKVGLVSLSIAVLEKSAQSPTGYLATKLPIGNFSINVLPSPKP